MQQRIRYQHSTRLITATLLCLVTLVSSVQAEGITIQSRAYQDPNFDLEPGINVFNPRLKSLWLSALVRPEVDYKRQAADAIAKAQGLGMPDLQDTAGALMQQLEVPDRHPVVALSCARALIALDARESAELLHSRAISDGIDMALLIEPALLEWNYEPIRKTWLDRIAMDRPPRKLTILALRGLAALEEKGAVSRLQELAVDSRGKLSVRLEASRAVAKLQSDGFVEDARKLAEDKSPGRIIDRLVAASLLAAHEDEQARQVLLDLAVDPEPAVAVIALDRLLQLDPKLVAALYERLISSADPKVRQAAVKAIAALVSDENIEKMAKRLDDPHPDVRGFVRDSFYQFASDPRYKELVIRLAMEMLATDRWCGLEQSSLLLGALDHEPAADRIAELIEHQKPQVYVAAAWGLRKLAVPSTLPAMRTRSKNMAELLLKPKEMARLRSRPKMINQQLRYLFEGLGLMKDTEAAGILARFVPKGGPWEINTRCSAIWAIGYGLEGIPNEQAIGAFLSRLNDVNGPVPEDHRVRRMSAIGLGRMQAKQAVSSLQRFYERGESERIVGHACAWALKRITGKDFPDPPVPEFEQTDWFLRPIPE